VKRLSLPTHAALELLAGIALMAVPFLLGFGVAGGVVSITAGVLLVGLALSGADGDGSLPLSAHQAFDMAFVAGLAGGGLALALSGDATAGLALAALAGFQLTLLALTRWTRAA
jgi:hypothetical protein